MRILLVLSKDNIYKYDSIHKRKYYPQITLITLASLIDSKYITTLELLDEGVEKYDSTSKKYDGKVFDLVCISSVISGSRRAKEIASFWKKRGAYTVIGGHYATLLKDEALKYFDTVINGPGEESFKEFIRDFYYGSPKREYFKIIGNNYDYKPLDRSLLKNKRYYKKFGTIIANNGCVNKCSYCSINKLYCGGDQIRKVERVIEEIKNSKKKKWIFYDPNFLSNRDFAIELMIELKKLNIRWTGSSVINIGEDIELLNLMKDSGCIGLVIGLESFIQENLKEVNKGFNNVRKYKEMISKIQSYGISVLSTIMIGMDTDTIDTIRRIPDLVEEIGVDVPRYNIITPYPGTKLFEELKNEDRILTTDWFFYDTETVVFKPKNMSSKELQIELYELWKETFKYKRIIKRVKNSKNKGLKLILEIFSRKHSNKFSSYELPQFIEEIK